MIHRDISIGNDYRKERVKHVTTLAAGIFAITVAFHKDMLLMFEKPVSTALDAAAKQISGGGASVEIAGLKITLPKSAIPSPPERVKNVLPKLEPEDIDFIIANTGGDNTLDICHQDAKLDAFNENSVFSRLKKLEMITFEKVQLFDSKGIPCLAGSKTQFKPLYNLVRSYLSDVLKEVTFNY
jgi:hypothetical protein